MNWQLFDSTFNQNFCDIFGNFLIGQSNIFAKLQSLQFWQTKIGQNQNFCYLNGQESES